MQVTSFSFEIVVGDDHSIDSTPAILKEYQERYPDKFVIIFNEQNYGVSENYKKVLSKCQGEYIALCEGDDYWTCADKLQLQFDFLEGHPNYGFVGSYNELLFPDGTTRYDPYFSSTPSVIEGNWELYGNVFDSAKFGPVTRTVSLFFRRSIIEPYINYSGSGNDLVLQTILAYHSCFAKYNSSLCTYRQGGISTDSLSLEKQLYYNNWYVENRLLQKKLFPEDCNWDEAELLDREPYILMKHSIKSFHPIKALKYKHKLTSYAYRQKRITRHLKGIFTCLALGIAMRLNQHL